MGQEAVCKVRYGGEVSKGKALLETNELIFRGEFRLKIPLKDIQSAEARNGELYVKSQDGVAVFELGTQAAKWLQKILHPPSLLDKLGVEANSRVAVLGVHDEPFARELAAHTAEIRKSRPKKDTDIILLGAETLEALEQLGRLQGFLRPNGAIWIVYPKGQKHISENDVLAAGRRSGLVDVKVAGFSATHTALKMVIPVHRRKPA